MAGVRTAIDRIDAAQLALLAARGRLAGYAGRLKRQLGLPVRDPARERRVHARSRELAVQFGLAPDTARRATALAVEDACRRQQLPPGPAHDLDQGRTGAVGGIIASTMHTVPDSPHPHPGRPGIHAALRLLPPPARWAPLLRAMPAGVHHRLLSAAMARVLSAPLADGTLDFMRGRRLRIRVTDLGLQWVVEMRDGVLAVVDGEAEASVRGTATDLLLMASRLEDADTLFFQRRLELTGDTELGLTVRNLLDRLPWESIPLGLRIGLNRGARLARAARTAYQGSMPGSPCQ
nr:SCP2 sterol-binding domain-containing protein [Lysobacter sp. GX 14042]